MRTKDLQSLPKVRDGWSYLYVDRCRADQEDNGIAVQDERGRVRVPCAMLATLMLGPGTTITHAAIRTLADNGCLVVWSGMEAPLRLRQPSSGRLPSRFLSLPQKVEKSSLPDLRKMGCGGDVPGEMRDDAEAGARGGSWMAVEEAGMARARTICRANV